MTKPTTSTTAAADNSQGGYIILLLALVVSGLVSILAAYLAAVSGMNLTSVDYVSSDYDARAYALACAEEALWHGRDPEGGESKDSISFAEGGCEFELLTVDGQGGRVEVVGYTDQVEQKLLIEVDRFDPVPEIIRWEQVIEF